MSRVFKIAIANQKGGEGKTTTAINLAFGLAYRNKRTLLLDLDPQANSTGIFIEPDLISISAYDVFSGNARMQDAVVATAVDNLSVVPSHITLAEMETIGSNVDAPYLIRDALQQIEKDFDYVVMDCPPSLSVFTINALVAASHVIIPAQSEKFSIDGMKGLQNTINSVKRRINSNLEILGALITQSKKHTVLHKTILPVLSEYFPVFEAAICTGVAVGESHLSRQSIFDYAPDSRQAQEYSNFIEEVIHELEK
ncbi:MAG: ParA family protein [Leptospiraceae bacterium]|nr:ParA family protein [Leptospiraceae bacterium]